ncbi:hypothetical protein ACFE04_023887 [Oxalis oulophora]
MASNKEHIVMLPFMAHGHLIPFLELARKIHHTSGYTITIACTPLNITYLRSTMAGDHRNADNTINLAELHFCSSDHGLPPNTENTENLTLDEIGHFFYSSTSLRTPVQKLLSDITHSEGKPPLCVISDCFYGWAVDVAKSAGTTSVSFTTGGAYGTLAYTSVWFNLPHRKSEADEFNVLGFPDRCRFHVTMLHRFIRNADGSDIWSRFMQPQLLKSMESSMWLCNTVEEIEPLALDWLRNFINNGRPVWAIGPLLPPEMVTDDDHHHQRRNFKHSAKKPGVSPEDCIKWLDLHSPDSVLYISFGSQNTISPDQMMALADGLEKSSMPFVWVIRPPSGKGEEMKNKAMEIKLHIRASIKDDGVEKGSSVKAVEGFIASVLLERKRQ